MSKTDPLFVRVSTPDGHFSVPAAIAARAGSDWTVLKQDAVDAKGRPLPAKLRTSVEDTPKPRRSKPAATPTPDVETASTDTEEKA